MKRVVGYIRRSTDNDNYSLQAQEKAVKSFAESQGWNLIKIYCDSSESGKTLNRPQFQKMIEESIAIDLILVMKLDRISRSLKDILILVEDILEQRKVGLKSVTESFDSSSSEGRLMLSMLGSFAEFERKRIIERMMDGKKQLADNGGWNGGIVPFGYEKCKSSNQIIVNKSESEIVRSIFNLYSSRSLSSNKLKVLTGCSLHRDSIYQLISNPFYTGYIEYGSILRKGNQPPLVDVKLFNKVQSNKFQRSKSAHQKFFKINGDKKILIT